MSAEILFNLLFYQESISGGDLSIEKFIISFSLSVIFFGLAFCSVAKAWRISLFLFIHSSIAGLSVSVSIGCFLLMCLLPCSLRQGELLEAYIFGGAESDDVF